MNISKEAVNKRFVECVEELITHDSGLSKKEIAMNLGLKPNTFSEILSGRMGVAVDVLAKFHLHYNIDVIWILTGNDGLYSTSDNISSVNDKDENQYKSLDVEHYKIMNRRLSAENKLLREQNTSLNEVIDDLRVLIKGFSGGNIIFTKPTDNE